ncbi:hypothetical protein SAMN05444274_105341 [Mariniphaga anaerophila]|uniref:Uncharacterized protein n=1 Tax=Mariniphaga anaerophila TaxID=1484053 RepID=A0A1M5BWI4_9BACT|nr:hypothetical protein [Mariniphaga anaerophila]SHF46953.1 hypothetical protein SAMN05444274_105341 [Mariniphaga anaerophila]
MRKLFYLLTCVAMLAVACDKNESEEPIVDPEGTELSGSITSDRTLVGPEYLLTGTLSVKDGATLTIPAGTVIKGKYGSTPDDRYSVYIIVEQGGKIIAEGTANDPIIMMSERGENGQPGDWGGLVINGGAYVSGAGEVGTNKGSTEVNSNIPYGGNVDKDDSGRIKYLVLAHTGSKSGSDKEHNGLTLNGVGSKTVIENVYVPSTADDAVEWFGGSVSVKNFLAVDSDDDMFDVTQGWSGTLDNAYGIWTAGYTSTEGDPRGIESDGNLDGNGSSHNHQSNYTMKNITIVTKATNTADSKETGDGGLMHDAIKVRRGATATITNCVVIADGGTIKDLIDLSDGKGDATEETSINVTYYVTNPLAGKEINKGEGTTYSSVQVTEATSMPTGGADVSAFGWVKSLPWGLGFDVAAQ